MGFKADLKEARARMQGGDPAQALAMIRRILGSGSPELKDAQSMYAVLVTAGLAGLAAEDYTASEGSFRKATEVIPDAPQAWKGLIDCLERAGKVEALPDAILPAVQIAEGKKNVARARTLRLRLAQVLESLGRADEAHEVLRKHVDNPDATVASETDSSPAEQLVLVLYAAVLEEGMESSAVLRKVEKRLGKDGGIMASTHGGHKKNRSLLMFDYRAKAVAKDDAEGGPVGGRFEDALQALEAAAPTWSSSNIAMSPLLIAGRDRLVARFVRACLRRAVQRAESRAAWRDVVDVCERFTAMGAGVENGPDDEGWVATTLLLVSTYQFVGSASELCSALESKVDFPWATAETCMYRAWEAWMKGDSAVAGAKLEIAVEARANSQKQDSMSPTHEGAWVGLSGPGKDWRELALQCLVSESLGYPGVDKDPNLALSKLERAAAAVDASLRVRGRPTPEHDLSGSLALAKASLLITLGQLDDARLVVEAASEGVPHRGETVVDGKVDNSVGLLPCMHCRGLCVASDVDIAQGQAADAREKLKQVLLADSSFADALSRLGWLLLGFPKDGRAGNGRTDDDVAEAVQLLERAVKGEPGSSMNAFRLARCYWESGGARLTDRTFCFNLLLRAAKLNPANAQAFEWLGHWYQRIGNDPERARGCFSRAVKLDPELRGAGEALALLYLQNGQETLALGLFRQCAAVSVACDWAWAGLSRAEMLEGKTSEAAAHLQQAIRGRPDCWSYWSDLGWCYHSEGKQAAALKAYMRAEELLESADVGLDGAILEIGNVELVARVRVKTQVGTIQRQIGQVDEAVSSFTRALELNPNSKLALEGAGEAYLAQAHARTSEGLYTAATVALRNGCRVTRKFLGIADKEGVQQDLETFITSGERDYEEANECAWKLLGDLYTYAHKLPPVCFVESELSVLETRTAAAVAKQEEWTKEGSANRLAFVKQGASAYQRAAETIRAKAATETSAEELPVGLAAGLYDLGLNHLLRSRLVCADAGEGSGLRDQDTYYVMPVVVELAKLAEKAFKEAIEADPLHSESWNGLGTVSRDPLVQQHCWVRSVQLAHNPSAWANLGMLYIRWGLDNQAYESLGGLQAVTDHPTMWVGLGLLKEKEASEPDVTKAKKRRLLSQASDAYYSSLEMGQHLDGLLGLGITAGRTHSQSDAIVALQQHLDLNPASAQAWNQLGAATELAGRISQAVNAYRRGLVLLQEQHERFCSDGAGGGEGGVGGGGDVAWNMALRLAKQNLGRVLAMRGEGEEAVSLLSDSDLRQGENVLQQGRAYAQQGDWGAALEAFQQIPTQGRHELGGLISAAAARYRKGDGEGALQAASALADKHPTDQRVLTAALATAALVADGSMVQRVARQLQRLPPRPKATDPDGRAERSERVEGLWAAHLATRAAGAPDTASRRLLCRAVRLDPSFVQSWLRLGAHLTDSAVNAGASSGTQDDTVSSDLAHACVVVAEKQAMFTLRSKAIDTQKAGAPGRAGHQSTVTTPDVTAQHFATTLTSLAKAHLCAGKLESTDAARKAATRAVHVYPGMFPAWRCLAAALVGRAVSSPLDSDEAKCALSDAHGIYSGMMSNVDDDRDDMVRHEAEYTRLLNMGQAEVGDFTGNLSADSVFAGNIMRARVTSSTASSDTVQFYKHALRAEPNALLGWRELAASYEKSDMHHASLQALESGSRAAAGLTVQEKFSTPVAAPLRLQMAANSLVSGEPGDGLRCVGDAFRVGKGGLNGHVLRGLLNARLGNANQAAQAFVKAKDAQPGMTSFVEELSRAALSEVK